MKNKIKSTSLGFNIAVVGTAITLLWIGLYKYTPTEAKDIQGVVKESPFVSWLNSIFSVQRVSNLIETFEIITAILLLLQLFFRRLILPAGLLSSVIFMITLSFLFTTPGMFTKVDGLLVANAFILKDIVLFGVSLQVLINGLRKEIAVV